MSAFFVFVFIPGFSHHAYADVCSPANLSGSFEHAKVTWVYDGDTLLLSDKRKIRLIGIDTPEVKHHQQRGQAYAAKAREALRALLKKHHYTVQLRYGKERRDRYKRTLAHVFLPDGTNLSAWLLERGYARTLAIPPNINLAACYRRAERLAQQQSLRLWRLKSHQLKYVDTLALRHKGYVRLKATVKQVVRYNKSLMIELVGKSKLRTHIKVKKKNLRFFKDYNLVKLTGREITVTGMIKQRHGKRILYLSHPSQLEIMPL